MADASILQGGQRVHARHTNITHLLAYVLFRAVIGGLVGGVGASVVVNRTQHWRPWDRAKIMAHYERNSGISYGWLLGTSVEDLVPPGYDLGQYTPRQIDGWLRLWWQRKYQRPMEEVYAAAAAGAGLAVLLFIISAIRMSKTTEKHVRGAELRAIKDLRKEVLKRSRGKPSVEVLPGLPIAKNDEFMHLLYIGGSGAGKSQSLNHLLAQARDKAEQVVVYDPAGIFTSIWHQEGDTIMNPLDERSAAWDIFGEIETPMDCDAIADSTVQSNGQGGPNEEYFNPAARSVMAETLKRMKVEGGGMGQAFERLSLWPMDRLLKYLKGTPAAIYLDPNAKGTGSGGIKSTLQTKVAAWQYLTLVAGKPFSIRDWVSNGSGWLFLTSKEKDHKSLEPTLSLWIELVARQILSREPGQGKRIWLVIDELASLQRLPGLLRLLAMGRKFKVVIVLATQSPGQLSRIYTREGLQEIQDGVGTHVLFRLKNHESAEAASKMLGEREIDRQQVADSAGRRQGAGVNFNTARARERIVMPSEIQSLPNLSCFVWLAGGYQPTRTSFKYIDRPTVAPAMVPRHIPFDFVVRNIPEDPEDAEPRESRGFSLEAGLEGRDA